MPPAPSLCDICADPVEDGVRRCESCAAEISEQLARMMAEPPTAAGFRKPGERAARLRPEAVGDDVAIRIWELYDEGYAAGTIAGKVGCSTKAVERALRDLDVWEGNSKPDAPKPKPKREKSKRRSIDAAVEGLFYKQEGAQQRANIAAALARINIPDEGLGSLGKVAFARSMQHVKPGARGPVIQSERQRRNGAVGAKWRSIIRMDMRRAGLLP